MRGRRWRAVGGGYVLAPLQLTDQAQYGPAWQILTSLVHSSPPTTTTVDDVAAAVTHASQHLDPANLNIWLPAAAHLCLRMGELRYAPSFCPIRAPHTIHVSLATGNL